jgi:hypothetical protein
MALAASMAWRSVMCNIINGESNGISVSMVAAAAING